MSERGDVASEPGRATPDRHKEVVRRFVEEVVNRHTGEALPEVCTPDHVLHHPALPWLSHGFDGYLASLEPIWHEWPDHRLEIQEIVAEGDRVGLRAVVTATNLGDLRGVKATGKGTRSHVIATYIMRDGKVAQTRVIEDIMTMLHEAGLVPRNLTALYVAKRTGIVALLQRVGKNPRRAPATAGPDSHR